MQDGIGRTGYRILAIVFAALGLLGLAILYGTQGAATALEGFGYVLAAIGLVALLGGFLKTLAGPAGPQEAAGPETLSQIDPDAPLPHMDLEEGLHPEAGYEADPAPPLASAEPAGPAIDLDSPLQRALAGLPPRPPPPPRFSPRMPKIPEPEPDGPEPVERARRLVPSGMTLGQKREMEKRQAPASPIPPEELTEFVVVPTSPKATKPRAKPVTALPVPTRTAKVAGGPVPPGMSRGSCGSCGTALWAPKTRPLNLRCPECDKLTLLK